METSQEKHTVESLTKLIRQNPNKAVEVVMLMPKDEADALVGALELEDYNKFVARAVANIEGG